MCCLLGTFKSLDAQRDILLIIQLTGDRSCFSSFFVVGFGFLDGVCLGLYSLKIRPRKISSVHNLME